MPAEISFGTCAGGVMMGSEITSLSGSDWLILLFKCESDHVLGGELRRKLTRIQFRIEGVKKMS